MIAPDFSFLSHKKKIIFLFFNYSNKRKKFTFQFHSIQIKEKEPAAGTSVHVAIKKNAIKFCT